MLQNLREKTQGFFAWVVIILIGGIFAFIGLGDYFRSTRGASTDAAIVDGHPITWRSVENIYQRVLYEQDVPAGSEQSLKFQIIAALSQRLALLMGLQSQGFRISQEQLLDTIKKVPQFEVDGKFSKEQFKTILSRMGYATEIDYIQDLSQDLLKNQLSEGLSVSTLEINQELKRAVQLLAQTRNIGYIILPANQYLNTVFNLIPPEAIKEYYDKHSAQFVFPEQVALDYIELSVAKLMAQIPLNDQDLKTFYDQNPALFAKPEQVHARHILISALHKDSQNAKEKAEAIYAKIKAGEDFATLAKTESDDQESAKEGGDLKWFGRGTMVPPFEEAVFGLKKAGDIAGPIQTNYGYHIIQLIDRKDPEKRSFEDTKALASEYYRKSKAEALFASTKERWQKLMRDNPADLRPIADALGLTVETTALFGRQAEKDTDVGIIVHPEIRKAAFSGQVLQNAKNSELLALNEGSEAPDTHLVMIHLNNHQAAKQQSLEEASPKIRTLLSTKQASEKAKELADNLVSHLKQSSASEQSQEVQKILAELMEQHQLKWVTRNNVTRENQELDPAIIINAFKLSAPDPKTGKVNASAFKLPNGDYVALNVTKVTEGDVEKLDKGTKAALQKKIAALNHQVEYDLYVQDILSKAKVKFFEMPEEVE